MPIKNLNSITVGESSAIDVKEIAWNPSDGTFDMGLLNDVVLQAGQEMHFYGKAQGAISNGDAVMFVGAQGDHLLMSAATQAAINANPEYFVGIATQDFVNNQFGYVTSFGKVRGLDTTIYRNGDPSSEGKILWFDSEGSTAGALTTVTPEAPNAKIRVAAVTRDHQNQGSIFVRPMVEPKLTQLQDVETSNVSRNDLLVWNDVSERWENGSNTNDFATAAQGSLADSAVQPADLGTMAYEDASDYVDLTSNQRIGGRKDFQREIVGSVNTGQNNLKLWSLRGRTYQSGDQFMGVYMVGLSGSNSLVLGGGTGSVKGATKISFQTNPNSELLGSTERMVITGNGNVGIGTTSPSSELDVNGTISLNGFDGLRYDTTSQGLYAGHLAGNNQTQSNAFGYFALSNNTGAYSNGFGYFALSSNTGTYSNGFGHFALRNNTGNYSNGFGYASLYNNQGANNTAIGHAAGYEDTPLTGGINTFLGYNASYGENTTITNSTAVGANVTLTDSNTVILGNDANVGIGTTSPGNSLSIASGNPSTTTLGTNFGQFGIFNSAGQYGIQQWITGTGDGHIQVGRIDGTATAYDLILQELGGNVGIGTTSPSEKLDVNGDVLFGRVNKFTTDVNVFKSNSTGQNGILLRSSISTAANPSFSNVDDPNTGMFLPGSDVLGLSTAGTERMRIISNGNVGIGTTSPSAKLDLGNSGALKVTQPNVTEVYVENTGVRLKNTYTGGGWARGILTYEDSTGTDYFQLGGYGSGQTFTYGYIGAAYNNNALRWYPNNSILIGNNLNVINNLTVGSTSTTTYKAETAGGSLAVSESIGPYTLGIELKGNRLTSIPSAQVKGYIGIGDNAIGLTGDMLIAPRTNVNASIRFITGTTPTEKVRIDGATGNVGIGTSSPSYPLDVNGDGRFKGDVRANLFIITSDADLKTNIKEIPDTKLNLSYKEYALKDDTSGRKRYGILADDIKTSYPELVHYNEKGQAGVDYISLLIKKVAELESEISLLNKRLGTARIR